MASSVSGPSAAGRAPRSSAAAARWSWLWPSRPRTDERLAVGGQSGFVSLWDVNSRRLAYSFTFEDGPCCRSLAFSPNGRLLAAALIKGPTVWHTAEDGGLLERVPARPGCVASALAFTPDGRRLLVGGWDGVVALHDLSSGALREKAGWHWGMDKVFGVAVSPNGMLAAAVGAGPDPVVLWDLD